MMRRLKTFEPNTALLYRSKIPTLREEDSYSKNKQPTEDVKIGEK